MANAVGRPSKYNEELQALADSYVFNWAEYDVIPSRVGLCCFLGINKATSFDWDKIHPEFSATSKAIEALQERVALNKGISGEFNSQITKLVLSNHGYSDRQAIDHTSADGSMSTGIDASKLSTQALKELMDAREPESK